MTISSPSVRFSIQRNLIDMSSDMMHSSPLIYAHTNIEQNHSLAVSRDEVPAYALLLPSLSYQANCYFFFPVCIKKNNST